MRSRSLIILAIVALSMTACRARFIRGGPPAPQQPSAPTRAPTRPVLTPAPTATPPGPRTPAPTFDFGSYLLTQAYAGQAPQASLTPAPPATTAPAGGSTGSFPTLIPSPHFVAPASVIVSEPILISNAVNTADCKIRNVGDCTPEMERGVTLFFTWTFGVRSSEAFQWGNAAVVIERDGQPFKWSQANDGLQRPPREGESPRLLTGQQAEFRAGLDEARSGFYAARLVMCVRPVADCSAGDGWQEVGGDIINFVITP